MTSPAILKSILISSVFLLPFHSAIAQGDTGDLSVCQEALEGESTEEATACLQDFIRKHPTNAEAHNELGLIFAGDDDIDQAKSHFDRAISLDPKLAAAYENRADIRYDEQNLSEALTDYTEAYRLDPHLTRSLFRIAEIHQDRSEFETAAEKYTHYLEITPKDPDALSNRGLVYYNLSKSDLALKDLSRALELAPDLWPPRLNRSLVYEEQKKFDEALADIDKVLSSGDLSKEGEIKALEQRARVRLEMKQPELALADVNKGLSLSPNNSLLLKVKIQILKALGSPELAAVEAQLKEIKSGASYGQQAWEESNVNSEDL